MEIMKLHLLKILWIFIFHGSPAQIEIKDLDLLLDEDIGVLSSIPRYVHIQNIFIFGVSLGSHLSRHHGCFNPQTTLGTLDDWGSPMASQPSPATRSILRGYPGTLGRWPGPEKLQPCPIEHWENHC